MPRWSGRSIPNGLVPVVEGSTVGHVVDVATGCWLWTGATNARSGYGMYRSQGSAHRFYYERAHGPVPAGLQLDHLCRTRRCVNPAHMEAVTAAVNIQRGRQARLSPDQVREIRRRLDAGSVMQKDLAIEYGVTNGTIHNILHRKHWRNLEATPL